MSSKNMGKDKAAQSLMLPKDEDTEDRRKHNHEPCVFGECECVALKMSGSASQVEKSCLGRQEQRSLLKKEVRKVVETVWTEPPGKGR